MPSEYHRQHCPCRDCRSPADRKLPAGTALTGIVLIALIAFSLAVVALVSQLPGAGQ